MLMENPEKYQEQSHLRSHKMVPTKLLYKKLTPPQTVENVAARKIKKAKRRNQKTPRRINGRKAPKSRKVRKSPRNAQTKTTTTHINRIIRFPLL